MLPKGSVPGSGAIIAPIGGALSPPSTVFFGGRAGFWFRQEEICSQEPTQLEKTCQ